MCVHWIGVAVEEEEKKAEPFLPSSFLCHSIPCLHRRRETERERERGLWFWGCGDAKMKPMNRGRREVKPFLLKAGFASLLFLTSFFTARNHPRRRALPPPPHSDDELDHGTSAATHVENPPIHQTVDALGNNMPRAPVTVEEDKFCSTSESSGEEEEFPGFLLPEFSRLIQRGPEGSLETMPAAPLAEDFEIKDVKALEEEIRNLKGLVQSLLERERFLERQLLEYHELKEQDVSMEELQNRLKISATEAKLLSLKIESFKAENEKLRNEASDYATVAAQLEMQRKKTTQLESKLISVGEQAKEKIAALHIRITELREKEKKDFDDAVEVEKKLKMLNVLDNEAVELRKENSRLAQEKLALLKFLESKNMLSPSVIRTLDSVLKYPEVGTLEEQHHLREENDKLKKKLEQLQTDHCADVEELVYLKWVNACLRYELRNYQPPPGRTTARDLSRCLSPKSEQKAKQLILEYSNSGFNLDHASLMEFNLDDCSSQASSEGSNPPSLGSASKTKTSKSSKPKILSRFKKLVLGNGGNACKMSRTPGIERNSEGKASVSACTLEEISRTKSYDSTSCYSVEQASGNNSTGMGFDDYEKWHNTENHFHDPFRTSLDFENPRRLDLEVVKGGIVERCRSDRILGAAYDHKTDKRMASVDLSGLPCSNLVENEERDAHEKAELKNFALVFSGYKESPRGDKHH